jgi:hypothetical protein
MNTGQQSPIIITIFNAVKLEGHDARTVKVIAVVQNTISMTKALPNSSMRVRPRL